MKKLVLGIKKVENVYLVKVLEQTHRGREFGRGRSGIYKGAITIESVNYPAYNNTLYVRGSNRERDNWVVCVSGVSADDRIQEIKATVRKYNEEFADENGTKVTEDGWERVE